MPADPEIIQDLFLRLVELPPAERAAALARECGSDVELQQRVAELLKAHEEPGSFLGSAGGDSPDRSGAADEAHSAEGMHSAATGEYTPGSAGPESLVTLTSVHRPGVSSSTVIGGRYRLQERIGEGGMGEVWVARQTEPIKRKVAVKLIKIGMDSRAVLNRFEQERQALALMDHPNIARVLDAGMTPLGQPFFVMELVNGLPLTRFCDEAHLTPRERLALFVPICQAVQHAHHKGIVHRDLKPANILVTIVDGKPVPKVIDFGVAKATSGKLTEESMSTGFGAVVGTLEYMSPEQASYSGVDVDTRADIYSLGVILYELLTGLRPIDTDRLRKAALTEMIRIIQEEEPSKPSTRLSTDASLPSLAALRQTEPRKLMMMLRGDLDWVVMKCLEKQRDRRYETANGLARDIQRYLADEAVEARPPSASYKLRKYVKRHRVRLAIGGLLTLLILGSGVVAWWQNEQAGARRETDLRRQLEDEQRLTADAARLARNHEAVSALLGSSEHALAEGDADEAEIALSAASRRAAEGGAEPETSRLRRLEADLVMLRDLESIDQLRYAWSGTRFTEAAAVANRTREALLRFGADPDTGSVDEATARVSASTVRERIVSALDRQLREERSTGLRALLQRVDADPYRDRIRDAVLAADDARLAELVALDAALEQPPGFAAFLGGCGAIDLERRKEVLEAAVTRRPDDIGLLMTLAIACTDPADTTRFEQMRWLQAAAAADPSNLVAFNDLGVVLRARGQEDAAMRCLKRALAQDPMMSSAHQNLGTMYLNRGELEAAAESFRRAIECSPTLAAAHLSLASTLARMGKIDEAIESIERVLVIDSTSIVAHINLGILLDQSGRGDEAIALLQSVVEAAPEDARAHASLGSVLRRAGRVDEAILQLRKAVELDPEMFSAHLQLGAILCDVKGDYEAAVASSGKAVEIDPRSAMARINLGVALHQLGRAEEARSCIVRALELDPASAHARYCLACSLLREAAALAPEERARNRRQAAGELRQAVDLFETQLETGGDTREQVEFLRYMQTDSDLASIRDADDLARLPGEEREALTGLWSKVASLLAHADPGSAGEAAAPSKPAAGGTDTPDAQITFLEQALESQKARFGPDHPDTLACMQNLAVAYWRVRQFDRSIPLFEELLRRFEAKLGPDDVTTLRSVANLGVNYRDAGRFEEALQLLEKAQLAVPAHPELGWVTAKLFEAYLSIDHETATRHLTALLPHLQTDLGRDHYVTLLAMNNLGYGLVRMRKFEEAEAMLLETIELEVATLGEGNMLLLQTRTNLGEMYLLQGRDALAEELLRRCLQERQEKEPDSFRLASTRSMLGRVLANEGKFAEAEELLLAGCEGLKAHADTTPQWGKYYLPDTLDWLAKLYLAMEKPDESARWQKELDATRRGEQLPSGER